MKYIALLHKTEDLRYCDKYLQGDECILSYTMFQVVWIMPFLHAKLKISNVKFLNLTKMYGFVWICLTLMMLMKRRQKFFDGYEHLDNSFAK